MKNLFITIIILCSCNTKDKLKKIDCSSNHLTEHLISKQYNASINLPEQWKIDTLKLSNSKSVVKSESFFSKDSSSNALIMVHDFRSNSLFNNDTAGIKKYLKVEISETKNNQDSIFYTASILNNNWTTVLQKSFIKGSKFIFIGQIISIRNSVEISLFLQISSSTFEKGENMLDCILSSYSVSN